MKLDRISAIVHSRPLQPRTGEQQPLPTPGETMLLTYDEVEDGSMLATARNGLALRLAGLNQLGRELQPGDTLMVKVLANEPLLELELHDAPARRTASQAGSSEIDTALMHRQGAMRLDQAALRQMAWQAPNAAALALSWRNLALERWNPGTTHEAAGDASTAMPTTMLGPAPFREPASTLPPPNLERWLFPVYAWGGMQMMLGLRQSEDDGPSRRQERRRNLILQLELAPAAVGRVVLQVQWVSGGIQLQIAVEHPESVQLVRDALPGITTALTRAGLRLTRFRLTQGSTIVTGLRDATGASQTHFATQASSLALFRALAETAVVLLQAVPGQAGLGREISRASR